MEKQEKRKVHQYVKNDSVGTEIAKECGKTLCETLLTAGLSMLGAFIMKKSSKK